MRILIIAVAGACLAMNATSYAAPSDDTSAQIAIAWNQEVLGMAEAEDGFLTLKGLRTVTMMHLAMHDAMNSVNGRYATYAFDRGQAEADSVIAAVEAAYKVALSQYPDHEASLAALRNKTVPVQPTEPRIEAGIDLGAEAARAILLQRQDDGWDADAEYQWHPMAPGVYAEFNEHSATPQGFIFGAGWGGAKGFALKSADQFRAPPPPRIDSQDYARAFNEVKKVGRFQCMVRTPDQSHLALWWKDFAENSHNRLARDLVAQEKLDLVDATRLFALLNMSIFDAYVSSFNNKFFYNHWRPYTAIRWAANDGNPATQAEETWTNLHRHTYAFPSYPSAHGTACAAAMRAFEDVFGTDFPFTMRNPIVDIAGPFSGKIEMHPASREFDRFSDAAMECALSRVYLGIHFRYDSIEGVALGQKVGSNVIEHALTTF